MRTVVWPPPLRPKRHTFAWHDVDAIIVLVVAMVWTECRRIHEDNAAPLACCAVVVTIPIRFALVSVERCDEWSDASETPHETRSLDNSSGCGFADGVAFGVVGDDGHRITGGMPLLAHAIDERESPAHQPHDFEPRVAAGEEW